MDFGIAKGVKESKAFLGAGIHKATFEGISYGSEEINGEDRGVMYVKFNVTGFGEYTHKLLDPKSNERKEMQWGPTPSEEDHFMVAVIQILEALNPQIVEDLNTGKITLSGSLAKITKSVKSLTDEYVGDEVEIKVLPQNNGFTGLPRFVAGLSKAGNLTIRTRFIGHDLTMNDRELKMIEAAKTATPTDMKKTDTSVADKLREDLGEDRDDDLPF